MAFSPSEAAFEGFRVIRREPLSAAIWAAAALVLGVAFIVAMFPMLQYSAQLQNGVNADPGQSLQLFSKILPSYAMMAPLVLLSYAVFSAAVFRAVLRPEDKGFGRIKFGLDELRQCVLGILLGLLFLVCYFGVIVAVIMSAAAAGAAFGKSAIMASIGFGLLGFLAGLGLLIWIAVRLSLAAPMTFAERRLRIFASWKLTRGRFWSLLGCYLLTFVFVAIMYSVAISLVTIIAVVASGGSLTSAANFMFRPDVGSMSAYFSEARILYLVLMAPFSAAFYAISYAPTAAAYRDIVADSASALP